MQMIYMNIKNFLFKTFFAKFAYFICSNQQMECSLSIDAPIFLLLSDATIGAVLGSDTGAKNP
jgi:hypothetical protein